MAAVATATAAPAAPAPSSASTSPYMKSATPASARPRPPAVSRVQAAHAAPSPSSTAAVGLRLNTPTAPPTSSTSRRSPPVRGTGFVRGASSSGSGSAALPLTPTSSDVAVLISAATAASGLRRSASSSSAASSGRKAARATASGLSNRASLSSIPYASASSGSLVSLVRTASLSASASSLVTAEDDGKHHGLAPADSGVLVDSLGVLPPLPGVLPAPIPPPSSSIETADTPAAPAAVSLSADPAAAWLAEARAEAHEATLADADEEEEESSPLDRPRPLLYVQHLQVQWGLDEDLVDAAARIDADTERATRYNALSAADEAVVAAAATPTKAPRSPKRDRRRDSGVSFRATTVGHMRRFDPDAPLADAWIAGEVAVLGNDVKRPVSLVVLPPGFVPPTADGDAPAVPAIPATAFAHALSPPTVTGIVVSPSLAHADVAGTSPPSGGKRTSLALAPRPVSVSAAAEPAAAVEQESAPVAAPSTTRFLDPRGLVAKLSSGGSGSSGNPHRITPVDGDLDTIGPDAGEPAAPAAAESPAPTQQRSSLMLTVRPGSLGPLALAESPSLSPELPAASACSTAGNGARRVGPSGIKYHVVSDETSSSKEGGKHHIGGGVKLPSRWLRRLAQRLGLTSCVP
ncbi:hypothetical protein H9P43_006021 [Blastocladiella emersonii ATCC 22665]|nr:hypothetical protein H9P43_006021 [Blastocladiella emersonii ATCC 22665]